MKQIIRNISLILVLLLCYCCNSDDDSTTNTNQERVLIFGWFSDSQCIGDCANIYKIDSDNIYKNVDYNYPETNTFQGDFQKITTVNYQDFVSLLDQLPSEIQNEPNGYLNCADCNNDDGGFYLEYTVNGQAKTWRFKNAQFPSYIETYRSLLLDKLAELNSL